MSYNREHYMAQIEPASHRQYPPDIQELLKSLLGAQETVKDLTGRLKTAEKDCRRLQTKWYKYSLTLSPIRTCPPEILSMIFWFYLSERQRWVRRLLLVCRQWNDIVINDPRLWNRIYLEVPEQEWDLHSISDSAKKHAQMCLQRSGFSLLDVKLNCSQLRSSRELIGDTIKSSFSGLFTWDPESDGDAEVEVEEWINSLDIGHLDVPVITRKCQPQHMFSAVRSLLGNRHENMGRLGSLELALPRLDEDKVVLKLWKLFKGPAPSLNRLVISTSGFDKRAIDEDLTGSFSCLTHLKYLDVDNARIFKNLTLHPPSVETLVLREGVRFWGAYNLSQFNCLQHLEIYNAYPSGPRSQAIEVSLPLLRQMTLHGSVQHLNQVQFHTPILHDFNITWRSEMHLRAKHHFLPNIESLHVCWQGYIGPYSGERWEHENLLKEMKMITVHFDKAKQLTVPDFARTALIETVQLLHQGGELSSALEMIGFENKRGAVETIEVRTLLLPNSS